MFQYIYFVSSLLILVESGQNWHTSQIVLKKLYGLQKENFNVINDYLDMETKRLDELKSYLYEIYEWWDVNAIGRHTYLHNHINGLKVMTRIHTQLRKVQYLMSNEKSIEVLKKIDEHKDLVNGNHILSAQRQLRRLQKFYKIPAFDMAAGRYNNEIIGDQLDACECYVMSKHCFDEKDVYGSIDWAIQAYHKWKEEGRPKCIIIEDLQFYIISLSVWTGNNIVGMKKNLNVVNYV